ncbi:unnamed protein product [Symbiodinium microadriaticum]|nr:unnamed protein product [Symbiodinium microadriaticum]
MYAIVAFIAFSCLASPSAGRRNNGNLAAKLGSNFEPSDEIAKAEATVEAVVENVDAGLNAAPEAEAQTWATVSAVNQVGPSRDDIVPKTSVNYFITTEGAAPSDPEGEYWLEANLSTHDGPSCDAFKSKVDRLLEAIDTVAPAMKSRFSLSCWHETTLTLRSVHRILAPHEVHAVKMFAMHLKHINVTESTMMDATTVLADKNKPILEEMFQGFRVDMDVALTKALEKERIEMQQQKTKDIVENVVAMFKGASSDMRLSYDDAKRRELFQSIPFLNASFNDIVAKLSVPVDHMMSANHGLSGPWLGPLVDVLEAADGVDTLDSVAIKNLPGVKAQATFTNVHPFKVAGSMLQDLGVIKFLRESAVTPPTAPAPAPAPKQMHSWRNAAEVMPPTDVETVQEVEAAVANRVLKAEAASEHAMESLESELPPTPTKLIPLKATISMGPSLGHFDTHETVSYMLFHENNKAAVDPSLGMQIEVNVTAASAEAAASFAELCNSLAQKLNTGPFLEVHSYGSLVTILSMPLPGGTAADGLRSLVPIMKHIGHLTFTVSANNNIEHMMAHPDDSIWKQAKTGAKFMLDATLTNAVEKALVDRLNASSGHDEVECATMEAPCLDTDHPGSCCSLSACVAPDDGEESGPNWQEIQCKYNLTCAPLCGGSAVAKTPRDYALAMSEKLMQIFTGGSLDVRVAYDDEMIKGIFASLPVLNMTFRSLQEQYRSLAQQNHLEKFASHPFAAAGVEVMNAVNKDLVSIESVELKNLPSDIRLVIKLENAKPFQFIFALLEGSGILGMLAGAPEPGPA